MESREAPYVFENRDQYVLLILFPLINDGQWGNAAEVGTEILQRLETIRAPNLVVDLSPLDYMGSAQVALLVRIWKSLKKMEGKFAVQCPSAMVQEVLTVAGLKSLWDVAETREEALGILGIRSPRANRGWPWSTWVSIVALLAAIGTLALCYLQPATLPAPTALLIESGLTLAALLSGAVAAIRHGGLGRRVGISVAVASAATFVLALMLLRW